MKDPRIRHFITSDLHLLHQRIIKYADRTKYEDTEEDTLKMTYDIVNFINENIPDEPGVVLWNLGDLFYGPLLNKHPLEELQRLVSIMRGKNRTLKLVLGNHDRDFRSLDWKKTTKNLWIEDYSDYHLFRKFGFDYVYDYPIVFGISYLVMNRFSFLKILPIQTSMVIPIIHLLTRTISYGNVRIMTW